MDGLVTAILSKALDGLSLRSAATAQDIANVSSEHFRPVSVSFETELRAAALRGEGAVRSLPLAMHQGNLEGGGTVRMDLELTAQSETAMRYGALVDLLAREVQLQRLIVGGGQ